MVRARRPDPSPSRRCRHSGWHSAKWLDPAAAGTSNPKPHRLDSAGQTSHSGCRECTRTSQSGHQRVEGMPREANAVDFWRGIALITIFINHVPGIYYARFTHANYSLSDSADLFVFLAGWSLRLLVGSPSKGAAGRLVSRAAARRPGGGTLRRADLDHDDRDRHAGGERDHPRQSAAARMAQCRGGVLRSDPDPYRARHPHPPSRLFRHPAALCGADGDGAGLRDHRPLRAQLAAAAVASRSTSPR